MKKTFLTSSIFAAAALTSQAATTLIDYDDQNASNGIHDTAVLDGNFQTDSSDAPNNEVTPAGSTNWGIIGTATNWQLRNDLQSPNGGGQNTVIGTESGGATRGVVQNTGYQVQAGDQFSSVYAWRDAFGWDSGETIDLFLFTTDDNTLGGVRTNLFTINSGNETANNTWETETIGLTTAVAGGDSAIGRQLFVSFEGNNVSANSFSRLDNVFLEVTAVPEPSSTALLGLGGLALLLRRRK